MVVSMTLKLLSSMNRSVRGPGQGFNVLTASMRYRHTEAHSKATSYCCYGYCCYCYCYSLFVVVFRLFVCLSVCCLSVVRCFCVSHLFVCLVSLFVSLFLLVVTLKVQLDVSNSKPQHATDNNRKQQRQ